MKNENSILFIIFSLGNGGSEKMLLNVLNNTKFSNYRKIIYLYNNISYNSYENLIRVPVVKYVSQNKKRYIFFSQFIRVLALIKIIRKENVRLIFSFSSQGALLATVVKLFLPFKKIFVIVRLGTVFNKLFYNPSGNKLKIKIWEQITLFFTYRFSDRIVCTTQFMKQQLISKSKKLDDKVVVIKNYIDKKNIETLAAQAIDEIKKYIVSVGRLEREKNHQAIIESFNIIKDKTDLNLVILGDGSLKAEILDVISDYGLQDRVFLKGFVNNPYKYIAKAELLILFSDFEGLPNVIIEALHCKTPVIVSNFSGVEDIITHNETGLIVERGNIPELALTIQRVLLDKNLRKNLAENGFISSLEYSNSIAKYEKLISTLLS